MKWKILESDYLFRNPWLKVRKDKVAIPNGHQLDAFYVLEYPDWVNVIGLTKDKQFVMVRQYRHGLQRISYELCAGVHDPGDDDHLATAKREMLEETGYGGGEWELLMVCSPNPSTHTNLNYTFVARGLKKIQEQDLDDAEDITVHLFSKEEILEMLEQNEIIQAMHSAPLWKFLYGEMNS